MNQEINKNKPFSFWLFLIASLVFLLSLTRLFLFGFSAATGYYLLDILAFLLFVLLLYLTEKQFHHNRKQITDLNVSFNREREALTDQIEKLKETVAACCAKDQERDQIEARQRQMIARIREKAKKPGLNQGVLSAIAEVSDAMSAILYKEIKPSGEFAVEATYGVPETFSPASFFAGEGLNGQVAADGNALVMEQIPEDYFQVTSGLGRSKPGFLYFLPVIKENHCIGLIELASFKKNDLERLWQGVSAVIVEEELF